MLPEVFYGFLDAQGPFSRPWARNPQLGFVKAAGVGQPGEEVGASWGVRYLGLLAAIESKVLLGFQKGLGLLRTVLSSQTWGSQ
jgi:hypothetical protein